MHTATSGVGDHREVEGWAEGRWKANEEYWENKLATCELVRNAGFNQWTILLPATFPELHRVFEEEVPRKSRVGLDAAPARARAPNATAWDPALTRGVPDLELAGFIARTATRAVVREAALERPALLDDPRFSGELVTLLERDLSRPPGKR